MTLLPRVLPVWLRLYDAALVWQVAWSGVKGPFYPSAGAVAIKRKDGDDGSSVGIVETSRMCGRFASYSAYPKLARRMGVVIAEEGPPPRYNIPPGVVVN